ncbi:MAG: DUF763 domain-containing protein [Armatimonadota bacterium]|nr:DUF763 domain-containing protein [Armatimonadota bacterium]MDR5702791.1 DUF763 domain-containing protein [Armatimonadota bacterium]
MRTGIAALPLHSGHTPRWLFERMTRLGRSILLVLVEEFGPQHVLRRLADPFWFQALGCVLGFDWHSSGVTTTVCGALKEALRDISYEIGLFVAGGKGRISRQTPQEILRVAERIGLPADPLIYASRMAAKVDSAAVQDGYQLYHHTFLFTREGAWAVIQQGMNPSTRYARRYHWLSDQVLSFVCEPHLAVCCDRRGKVLNLVAQESERAREVITDLSREQPERIGREWEKVLSLHLPSHHEIRMEEIHPKRLSSILLQTYEAQPPTFESLLGLQGVGPRTLRALALIAELIYGTPPSFRDPARFSFAHGGKDGHPYPVDRRTYDQSIAVLEQAVMRSRTSPGEKDGALRRLMNFLQGGAFSSSPGP